MDASQVLGNVDEDIVTSARINMNLTFPEADFRSRFPAPTLEKLQKIDEIKPLLAKWRASNPPDYRDGTPPLKRMWNLMRCIDEPDKWAEVAESGLQIVQDHVEFQLSAMEAATAYKNALKVDFEDCSDWYTPTYQIGPDRWRLYSMIASYELFQVNPRSTKSGQPRKAVLYLCAISKANNWSINVTEEKLKSLQDSTTSLPILTKGMNRAFLAKRRQSN